MDDNKLDNILKNAFSKEIPIDDISLDEFEMKLHKKMFYKFSWQRFNIYYMSSIGICLFSSIFLLLNQNLKSSENIAIESTRNNHLLVDSIPSNPKNRVEEEKLTFENKAFPSQSQKKSSQKTDSIKTNTSPSILNDTSTQNTLINPENIVEKPLIVKRKKTVFLASPRDTIIKFDTIKIKKGRRK